MSEDLPVIETSLAEDIEYYRHFYNFAPIGFYITKVEDGEFVLANPACIKMLGFKTFEELKANCKSTQLYPPRQRTKLIQSVMKMGLLRTLKQNLILKMVKKFGLI